MYKTTERVPSSRANLKNAANALHSMCMSNDDIPFSIFITISDISHRTPDLESAFLGIDFDYSNSTVYSSRTDVSSKLPAHQVNLFNIKVKEYEKY